MSEPVTAMQVALAKSAANKAARERGHRLGRFLDAVGDGAHVTTRASCAGCHEHVIVIVSAEHHEVGGPAMQVKRCRKGKRA